MYPTYSVREWDKYQHYKDRDPPWVKLHRNILTSRTWIKGTDRTRMVQVASILLAARYGNEIPYDFEMVKPTMALKCTEEEFLEALDYLNGAEFIEINGVADCQQDASTALAKCSPRREEESREEADSVREAFSLFVDLAKQEGLSVPERLTKSRKASLRQRLKDCGGIEGWKSMLEKLKASDYCMGRVKDWQATFDFVLQESSFTKIMEGAYNNRKPANDAEPAVDPKESFEMWKRRLTHWRETGEWESFWQGKPGEEDCIIPTDALAWWELENNPIQRRERV